MRLFLLLSLLLLNACSDLGYYWHTTSGHMALMNARVEIDDLLADPELDPGLRQRLQLVQQIRQFSIETLSLPESGSYNKFVQLDRAYVLQNLFVAEEFSTKLHAWCYPIVGCAGYRGYYDADRLADYVSKLKTEKYDTYISNVPAYSTLGWFDDPVLSSFIYWPDYRLAGLLFHELSHQRIFIENDTGFNESMAVAVQQVGTDLWLEATQREVQRQEYQRWIEYQRDVVNLIEQTREGLEQLYRGDLTEVDKRLQKQALLELARANYTALALRLNYRGGYEGWFAGELNNARLGSVAAYHAQTPAFLAILAARQNDFAAFFATVDKISRLDKPERDACLAAWAEATLTGDNNPVCGMD